MPQPSPTPIHLSSTASTEPAEVPARSSPTSGAALKPPGQASSGHSVRVTWRMGIPKPPLVHWSRHLGTRPTMSRWRERWWLLALNRVVSLERSS